MFAPHSKGIVRLKEKKKKKKLLWGKLTHLCGLILKFHYANIVRTAFLQMLFPFQTSTVLRLPQGKSGAVIQTGGEILASFSCNLSLPS